MSTPSNCLSRTRPRSLSRLLPSQICLLAGAILPTASAPRATSHERLSVIAAEIDADRETGVERLAAYVRDVVSATTVLSYTHDPTITLICNPNGATRARTTEQIVTNRS